VCDVLDRVKVKRGCPISKEDWDIVTRTLGPIARLAGIQEDTVLRNRDFELMLDREIDKAIEKECTDHGHGRYGMAT